MSSDPRTSPQSRLIASLGGATRVAELLVETFPSLPNGDDDRRKLRDRIYKWHADGSIPHRWRPYMRRVAADKDETIPEDLRDPAEAA